MREIVSSVGKGFGLILEDLKPILTSVREQLRLVWYYLLLGTWNKTWNEDMTKRFFAVGFKNWIEIRSSNKPPIKHKSASVREVPVGDPRSRYYNERTGKISFRKYINKEYKISCVHYIGGKVIGTLKANSFIGIVGFGVLMNDMIELTDAQVKQIAAKKGIEVGDLL